MTSDGQARAVTSRRRRVRPYSTKSIRFRRRRRRSSATSSDGRNFVAAGRRSCQRRRRPTCIGQGRRHVASDVSPPRTSRPRRHIADTGCVTHSTRHNYYTSPPLSHYFSGVFGFCCSKVRVGHLFVSKACDGPVQSCFLFPNHISLPQRSQIDVIDGENSSCCNNYDQYCIPQ